LPQGLAKQPFRNVWKGRGWGAIRTLITDFADPYIYPLCYPAEGVTARNPDPIKSHRPLNKNKGGGIFNKGYRVNKRLRIRRREVGDRVNTGTRTQTLQYHKLTFSPIEL
jgi:hypothetical protein